MPGPRARTRTGLRRKDVAKRGTRPSRLRDHRHPIERDRPARLGDLALWGGGDREAEMAWFPVWQRLSVVGLCECVREVPASVNERRCHVGQDDATTRPRGSGFAKVSI